MAQDKEIEIRSDEVQEILNHVPHSFIRWGITIVFMTILLLLFASWFVKYPDIITGKAVVSTVKAPVKLISKSNGVIHKLYAKENQWVNKGDKIAEVENAIELKAVERLKELTLKVGSFMAGDLLLSKIMFNDSVMNFGELQSEYNQIKSTCNDYQNLISNPFYSDQIADLKKQLMYYKQLAEISKQQQLLSKENLKNKEAIYNANKQLYDKGLLSNTEFFQEREKLNQIKQQIQSNKSNTVQQYITIAENQKKLKDLGHQFKEEKRKYNIQFANAINNINNHIKSWTNNFLFTAPFSGHVSYLENFSVKQFVEAGMPLFAVVPKDNSYNGTIEITTAGYGKVVTGQKVRIKLANYPYMEYGQLLGRVEECAKIPNKETYLVKFSLENELITTYNKNINYMPNMTGEAEIVTEDLRLLERVFHSFKKLFV